MDRNKSIENILNIRKLIANAENIKDMEFRLILEGLIKQGDENSEYAVIKYMNSIEIGLNVRLNIIRSAGYLHYQSFLVPLKKIIETENNVHLKKEAIISIAKYNDRRALNILNLALKDLRNSLLLQTLNNEISKIKQNNPILTLIPRFINEKDNHKSFRVTIDILKRILNFKDSLNFLKFLAFKEDKVRIASFEILCFTGPNKIKNYLYDFYKTKIGEIECVKNDECDGLLLITSFLKVYFERFPNFVDEKLSEFEDMFIMFGDIRIKTILLAIISISKSGQALMILERIYNDDETFREAVVGHLGKNKQSFDFLFNVYMSNELEPSKIIYSLMLTDMGVKYFFKHFDEKEYEEQALILTYFPFYDNRYYVEFCRKILNSDKYNLKILLLEKIKQKGEFSVKDILFAPENESKFLLMEKEYLSTILKLFPISAVKKMFEIIVSQEFSVTKTKRFLKLLQSVLTKDIVFDFEDSSILHYMANKVVNMNNYELNVIFLSVFANIKIFNSKSFNDLNIALNIFINQRGNKINIKEKYEIRKIKENITNLSIVNKKFEMMNKSIKLLRMIKSDVLEKLVVLIKENMMYVPFYIDELVDILKTEFVKADYSAIPVWINFFYDYPQIAKRMADIILEQSNKHNALIKKDLTEIYSKLPSKTKIVLKFVKKDIIAILLDQFSEIITGTDVIYENTAINKSDILLCDAQSFKVMAKQNSFKTKHMFLFLDKISEFSEFKSYNPRFFVKPYSFYRILKDILNELFVISE